MLRNTLFLMAIAVAVSTASVAPVIAHEEVDWVPSLYEFSQLPETEMYVIPDAGGQGEFEVTVGAVDGRLLDQIDASNFAVEILPAAALSDNCSGAGVVVDGRTVSHDQFERQNQRMAPEPPPLFVKVHYRSGTEPERFKLTLRGLPETRIAVTVNAGHYQSIALRRWGSGSSYVRFYHHHGDWQLHVLYEGWFSRCTYAYDCYAGHSIPSWTTSRHDEAVEFGTYCWEARCR